MYACAQMRRIDMPMNIQCGIDVNVRRITWCGTKMPYANSVATDQPSHQRSMIWELHCPLICRIGVQWLKSGQRNSQVRLRRCAWWPRARLSAYGRRQLLHLTLLWVIIGHCEIDGFRFFLILCLLSGRQYETTRDLISVLRNLVYILVWGPWRIQVWSPRLKEHKTCISSVS